MSSVAVVASTATVAVAAPSIARAPSEISFPELATRFAAVYARWKRQIGLDREHDAAFERAYKATTGHAWADRPDFNDPGYADWRTSFEEVSVQVAKTVPPGSCNKDGEIIAWSEIHGELYPLCEEILRAPARTIADLGLQAQAYALMNSEAWIGDVGDGSDLRALVSNVCKLAGVEPLPGIDVVAIDDEADEEA